MKINGYTLFVVAILLSLIGFIPFAFIPYYDIALISSSIYIILDVIIMIIFNFVTRDIMIVAGKTNEYLKVQK